MEAELEKFRKQKRLENYKSQWRTKVENWWFNITNKIARAVLPENDHDSSNNDDSDHNDNENIERSEMDLALGGKSRSKKLTKRKHAKNSSTFALEGDTSVIEPKAFDNKRLYYIQLIGKCLIWIFLFMGFLKLELGAVYFVISMLWLIWTNTSTSKKKDKSTVSTKKAPSAYSVFNPNCEAIDGTLKAEQLEKQLLFRETK